MRTRFEIFKLVGLLTVLCVSTSGCQVLHSSELPNILHFADAKSKSRAAVDHRRAYQLDKSPASLKWLLANRIETGMSPSEVNQVLGEQGTREYDDRWIKTHGGHYRSGDRVYKWSPDSEGNSLYLVFRDGRLVNFDPDKFNQQSTGPL